MFTPEFQFIFLITFSSTAVKSLGEMVSPFLTPLPTGILIGSSKKVISVSQPEPASFSSSTYFTLTTWSFMVCSMALISTLSKIFSKSTKIAQTETVYYFVLSNNRFDVKIWRIILSFLRKPTCSFGSCSSSIVERRFATAFVNGL